MPNWVDNKVLVITEEENKEKLKELLDTGFHFHKFLPIPFDLDAVNNPHPKTVASSTDDPLIEKEMLKLHGAKNWYDWCVANWGTKWDHSDYEVVDNEWEYGRIEVFFRTAWSPPYKILQHISKVYGVKIIVHYEEEGFNSAGHLEFENGKMGVSLP